jgi:hypothetical protein
MRSISYSERANPSWTVKAEMEWSVGVTRQDRAPHPVKLLLSSIERLRTADEPIAAKVESQRTAGCARNADPFAPPDFA